MATPKAVSKSLRKTATRLASIKREAVAEAAQDTVERASSTGRSFFGGRYPLLAEVVEKRENKKRTTVLVYPKPAGAWSILSYGRGESRGPLVIPRVGVRPRARATGGTGGWDRIKEHAEDNYPEVMEAAVDEVIGDG